MKTNDITERLDIIFELLVTARDNAQQGMREIQQFKSDLTREEISRLEAGQKARAALGQKDEIP